jgi:hypothetical protein
VLDHHEIVAASVTGIRQDFNKIKGHRRVP